LPKVISPSGVELRVRDGSEKKFYEKKVEMYSRYKLEHHSDLDVLDQLLYLMLCNYRFMTEIADADSPKEDERVQDFPAKIRANSSEIRQLLDTLQLSAKTRQEEQELSSVKNYINLLLKRAEVFKRVKDKKSIKSIENMAKMSNMLRMRRVCDKDEKDYLGLHPNQILDKFESLINEYKEIDEDFKEEQKIWWTNEDE